MKNKTLRLHSAIARDLGVGIVSGHFQPGHILDGEIESSEQLNVSRTAYREAVRILCAKGLVNSRPKVGTTVNPQCEWNLLDADVLSWVFDGEPEPELLRSLFELRFIVEPQAASLAARRRSKHHLDAMRAALEDMRKHTLATEAGRVADQSFHSALLSASKNPFLISLTRSVTTAVAVLTEFKQRATPLRRDPVPDHAHVYEAIAARNQEKANEAMTQLIRLAVLDTPMNGQLKRRKK